MARSRSGFLKAKPGSNVSFDATLRKQVKNTSKPRPLSSFFCGLVPNRLTALGCRLSAEVYTRSIGGA
jgi:hypothetical protein